MNLTNAWSIERTDELKALWAKGFSASHIASELGGLTRNAVLGKLHRMKVAARPKGLPKPKQKRRRAAPRPKQPRPFDLLMAEPELIELPFDQSPDAITIAGLGDETCRWPLGQPAHDMLYCGSQRHAPFSYCTRHAQIAYKPAKRR